jgi:D-glycero-D-manno-heptose 1,7-bisphosphate phosphatase
VTPDKGAPAAFLDRDGVINLDHGYVHTIAEFQFIPGVLSACHDLHAAGYKLIVVTNQAGIGRGYYDEQAFRDISEWMSARFAEAGAPLTGIYYCPHHPQGTVTRLTRECDCRKPAPGMILQAVLDHRIDVSKSFLVGDKRSDIEAAERAGVAGRYLIQTDRPAGDRGGPLGFRSLADVVQHVLTLGIDNG